MKIAEICSVGEELCRGVVTDTNATFLSRALSEAGFQVKYRQTCGDDGACIESLLRLALSRSDVVLVTGGLGPTYDDITRQCAAAVLGVKLVSSPEVEKDIRAYFSRRGVTMSENNLLQALTPEGAKILKNHHGTAPGLWMEQGETILVLLPGVPSEMKELFVSSVLPQLKQKSERVSFTRILHCYGIPESTLDAKLKVLTERANPVIAPYAVGGEVEVHVTAHGKNQAEAETICRRAVDKIKALVGNFIYGEGDTTLEKTLVHLCLEKGIRLSTAESCTGGLLSHRITSVPMASRVMTAGIASYTVDAKKSLLQVSEKTLSRYGVYSKECALEMARGVRALSGADVGIGITGMAGPGGGTDKDPVGTVYLAVVSKKGEEAVREVFATPETARERICHLAVKRALAMTLSHLRGGFSPES